MLRIVSYDHASFHLLSIEFSSRNDEPSDLFSYTFCSAICGTILSRSHAACAGKISRRLDDMSGTFSARKESCGVCPSNVHERG